MNDTKKKKKKSYYSPSALARWGHNSRKRLCRQEGEVSGEYVHPWVAAGGFWWSWTPFWRSDLPAQEIPLPPSLVSGSRKYTLSSGLIRWS